MEFRVGPHRSGAAENVEEQVLRQNDELKVQRVRLAQIDLSDSRFQYRLSASAGDLMASLAADGQQVPVTLWAPREPYKIIDGFRRIAALSALNVQDVNAILRSDIDEDDAFTLSFIENVKRKNYTPLDKANAIWFATHRRLMKIEDVAREFGLSERQVHRYLALLTLTQPVAQALLEEKITMAHAVVLKRSMVSEPARVIERIQREALSVNDLKRILKPARRGRPRRYIVKDGDGFRATPFRYHSSLPPRERRMILEALEGAIAIVRHSVDRAG